jgi:SRSO17 transposase
MNLNQGEDSETRFAEYVAGLASVIGRANRTGPLRDYCTGLMLPGERKSVEPMAARTAPARTAAQHQSLLHFVGIATWSDEEVLAKVREMVLPAIEKDRSRPGSSTTRPSPSKASIRLACTTNIAGSSASRPIAR